jgi:hypothetical protein
MKKVLLLLTITFIFCVVQGNPEHNNSISSNSPLDSLIMVRSNLYAVQSDGSTILLDGDMTQYESDFSNNLDSLDIRKMSNFSENIGMIRGTTTLVVERRKTIDYTDTIFFKLWQTHQRTYQLEFITTNMEQPGLSGYLEDLYLHTKTPISLIGTNHINVSITSDPASANIFRFRLIFAKTSQFGLLPLTFTSMRAYQQNSNINVEWSTENESNLKNYTVEKSIDGINFSAAFRINAKNTSSNSYQWIDNHPKNGENYYRISSTGIDDRTSVSQIFKLSVLKGFSFLRIYPNPIKNNSFNLLISNEPAGLYKLRLFNPFGQLIMQTQIQHTGGTSVQVIPTKTSLSKGVSYLEIIKPDGTLEKVEIMY